MLPRGGCHQTDLFIRRHLSAIMGGDAIPLRPCRTSSKNIGAFRGGPDDLRQAGHSELGIEERATSGLQVDIIQTWTTLGEGKYRYTLLD